MLKNEAPDSPATAFASNVFPVPGLPSKRTPLGTLAPAFVYLSGFFRKSTTSFSSSFAPSTPATSSNFTSGFLSSLSALDLPKPKMFPGPPCPFPIILLSRYIISTIIIIIGKKLITIARNTAPCEGAPTTSSIFLLLTALTMLGSFPTLSVIFLVE